MSNDEACKNCSLVVRNCENFELFVSLFVIKKISNAQEVKNYLQLTIRLDRDRCRQLIKCTNECIIVVNCTCELWDRWRSTLLLSSVSCERTWPAERYFVFYATRSHICRVKNINLWRWQCSFLVETYSQKFARPRVRLLNLKLLFSITDRVPENKQQFLPVEDHISKHSR